MNRVATLATAEKEKAIGEHTSIVQMPPERNEPSCLGGGRCVHVCVCVCVFVTIPVSKGILILIPFCVSAHPKSTRAL